MNNLPVSFWRSLIIIVLIALTTLATRAIPFLLFPEGKEVPKSVQYLGKVLPPAVIGMLVVYCFKSMDVTSAPFGLPEIIAGLSVALLHVWKRNDLLSIGVGTVLYMVLVQFVFV